MKNTILLSLASFIVLIGCERKKKVAAPLLAINLKMLDSIKQHSDSIYQKPYKRSDFVTAEYFISRKDSTLTQLMKDSSGNIRQIIIEKGKRRSFIAEFYSDGQQKYKVSLDEFGQYDGAAEEYNENGSIKRSGTYKNGIHVGKWKNYDDDGKYISTDIYNENGQQEKNYIENQ